MVACGIKQAGMAAGGGKTAVHRTFVVCFRLLWKRTCVCLCVCVSLFFRGQEVLPSEVDQTSQGKEEPPRVWSVLALCPPENNTRLSRLSCLLCRWRWRAAPFGDVGKTKFKSFAFLVPAVGLSRLSVFLLVVASIRC